MTATNAFPLAAKNELIILHSHHPLNWTKEEFVDMFHLTDRWWVYYWATICNAMGVVALLNNYHEFKMSNALQGIDPIE